MTIIAPSVLAANFLNLERELSSMEQSGADWLHLDVMDGHFVPNLSFGLPVISAIREWTDLFLDVHLMISNPYTYIDEYIKAGADSITFHVEAVDSPSIVIRAIKEKKIKAGIAIKPNTPFFLVKPYLKHVDMLLFMTVEPGFGGQSFIPSVLDTIKEADEYRKEQNLDVLFQVDGGINVETAELCRNHGVDVLVAGTTVFSARNRKEIIQTLRDE